MSKCGVNKDSSSTFGVPNFTRISGDSTYLPTYFVNIGANSALFKIVTSIRFGTVLLIDFSTDVEATTLFTLCLIP